MIRMHNKEGNLNISIDEKIIMVELEGADVVDIVVHNTRTGKTTERKLHITDSNKTFLN